MSEENCPRCSHEKTVSSIALDGVDHWHCGTYREPSGNIYESELCETRKELRIQRELATQFEAGAALLIVRAEKAEAELKNFREARLMGALPVLAVKARHFSRIEEAEAELAKREEALEQAVSKIHPIINFVEGRGIVTGGSFLLGRLSVYSDCWPAEETPELAEWLKQRNK